MEVVGHWMINMNYGSTWSMPISSREEHHSILRWVLKKDICKIRYTLLCTHIFQIILSQLTGLKVRRYFPNQVYQVQNFLQNKKRLMQWMKKSNMLTTSVLNDFALALGRTDKLSFAKFSDSFCEAWEITWGTNEPLWNARKKSRNVCLKILWKWANKLAKSSILTSLYL